MLKVITIRCKGGSSKAEEAQLESIKKQEAIQAQMEAIDLEFYELRQENKRLYDQQFRPMEESLLQRAVQPAREATSDRARAAEYEAADTASAEALARRRERYGISNERVGDVEDDTIRAIALTAVGNASKMSALETQSNLTQAAMGFGVGVNQDITRTFGRSMQGMQQGLGHADAAFANYAQAQSHMNNAYLAEQAGIGSLIKAGTSVAGIGISNYNLAGERAAYSGGSPTWQSAFTAQPTNPSAGNMIGTPLP